MTGRVDDASGGGVRFSLTHRTTPDGLAPTRAFAGAVARVLGAGAEQVEDLKLAVTEACVNAIEAGISEEIGIDIVETAGRVVVRVGLVDPDPPESIGFDLIAALFGTLEFRPDPSGGAVVEFDFIPERPPAAEGRPSGGPEATGND
jgi:anti-sigma regulatory factor (Ser/Thr protein kinase)